MGQSRSEQKVVTLRSEHDTGYRWGVKQCSARAHKNKIGTSTPPPFLRKPRTPPSPGRKNFMGMGVFQQKEPKNSQAPIKLARPPLAPELRAENYGHEAFLGRPVCRTKLPRKALISKRKMVRKTTRNFPEIF